MSVAVRGVPEEGQRDSSLVTITCNLCEADGAAVVYDRPSPDGVFSVSESRMTTDVFTAYGRIVRCRRCGLVYTNPRPASTELLASYSAMEDAEYLDEQDCRSMNAHLSLMMIKRYADGGRLLDVGCSTGFFLNAARADFVVSGVEPSHWAGEFAREKLHLDVVEGTLDDAPFPAGHFDVVTLIDVIEHVTDPKAVLSRAAQLLRPGGVLYLVTPDIGSVSARLLRGRWWGLRPAHITYFSRRTLKRMLSDVGFSVLETRSYGRIFTYGYWLSRLRNYPAPVYHGLRLLVRCLGLSGKVVYINTRDSVELCARRRA
jgi:2-polyprenyl-3-methyl-5-hydroxy-6-metoxy-1,4-benzoquinol methylase